MYYSLEKVVSLIGARRFGNSEAKIKWLLTDSRSLAFPETTLFFALRTRRGDGHKYITTFCSINEIVPTGTKSFKKIGDL